MRYGKNNNNWKGGRRVTSHGYIEIRVPKDHPLRNKNGYAYEHRIVAMGKLGRPLKKGEIVHHKNGNRQDNSIDNIEVVNGNAEHRYHHRKTKNLRKPNEKNITINCKCGCGKDFDKYDSAGRPRMYISGHNPHSSPTENLIMNVLTNKSCHRIKLAEEINKTLQQTAVCLSKLKGKGIIKQVNRGIWIATKGKNNE